MNKIPLPLFCDYNTYKLIENKYNVKRREDDKDGTKIFFPILLLRSREFMKEDISSSAKSVVQNVKEQSTCHCYKIRCDRFVYYV